MNDLHTGQVTNEAGVMLVDVGARSISYGAVFGGQVALDIDYAPNKVSGAAAIEVSGHEPSRVAGVSDHLPSANPTRFVRSRSARLDRSRARNSAAFPLAVSNVAERLFAVVTSRALQSGVDITGAALDVEVDPEEGTVTPVLRIELDASAAQALVFWESLAPDIDRWYERLDPVRQDALMRVLGLRIIWR